VLCRASAGGVHSTLPGRSATPPGRVTQNLSSEASKSDSGVLAVQTHNPGEGAVIALGVILLIIGFIAHISILWVIGVILLVIGLILALMGMMGRAVGGRAHYY
jgi:hypothetical protein